MTKWAASSVVLFLFVFAAFAQPGSGRDNAPRTPSGRNIGTIIGQLRLPSGQHEIPEMVSVTLKTLGDSFVQQRTLSEETSFTFTNVSNGHYIIEVESMGYETTETPFEVRAYMPNEQFLAVVPLGQRTSDPAQQVPGPSGQIVSAKWLAIPEKAREEMVRAEKEAHKNNPQKAIKHLKKALEIYPDFYEAYNNLAVQYTVLRNTEEAKDALLKSISINPADARAYRNLGQIHLGQGRVQEAFRYLRQAIDLEPEHSTGVRLMGETYLLLGQYQLALGHFQKALQKNPKEHSRMGMAQCYLGLGRYADALEELKGFLEIEPTGQRADAARRTVKQLEARLVSNY